MKSIQALGRISTSLPLPADDITELHAARLLLLFHHCGSGDKVDGLTKLAKLDFFVRYPIFFERVARQLGNTVSVSSDQTESLMVRHHYGPWDKRYYQVLAFLESRGLITVQKTVILTSSPYPKWAARRQRYLPNPNLFCPLSTR